LIALAIGFGRSARMLQLPRNNASLPHPEQRGVRSGAPFFAGEAYRRNLEVVRKLKRLAAEQLGVSVSRLAIAWTLANPAVQVAIVGARHPGHIEDSVAAADLNLSRADLEEIDRIMADSVPLSGPAPEMMPE
jgi:aryl-alcohol dehydrogenase-like predicted oxidoreductase